MKVKDKVAIVNGTEIGASVCGAILVLPYDKDEQLRSAEAIDAGCYQYVEYAKEDKR